jgi:hypothetical protein
MSLRTLLNKLLVPSVPLINSREGTENSLVNKGCLLSSLCSLAKEHRQVKVSTNITAQEPIEIKAMCKCGRYRLPFCSCGLNSYQNNLTDANEK